MNLFYKLTIIFLIGLISCKGKERDLPITSSQSEFDIERVKLSGLDDKPIELKKYSGKTVFINFWATWCKPCREEMPSIRKIIEILKNENIVFLFATEEAVEEIENFKAEHDYGFNFVTTKSLGELNIMGLPTTFIFNPYGKLVFSEMGSRKWDDKESINLIRKILKQK